MAVLPGLTLVLHAVLAAVAPEVPVPPGAPRLEWVAPPGCPDAARGADELARFLGGRALPALARVELRAGAEGYTASVTVDGASRALHASDCETLARAAALVVAVSLDPVATAAMVLGPVSAEVEATPGAVPEPAADEALGVPPEPPATNPPARRTTSARADMPARAEPPLVAAHWLGASGGIALALVPALTGAVRLGYAFERNALRVQANATYATPRSITYPDEPGVGGRFQSVVLGVQACFAPAVGRVAVPLCGGLEGGPVIGRGFGVTIPRSPVSAWIGALAGGSVVVRLHPRLALTAGADLLVSLRRPAFHVGARETLFSAPSVGLRALAGLALRLW